MFYLTYVRIVNWNLIPKNWLKLEFTLLSFFYFFYLILVSSSFIVTSICGCSYKTFFPFPCFKHMRPALFKWQRKQYLNVLFSQMQHMSTKSEKSVLLHCVSEIFMKNNVLFKQKAHFFCYFSLVLFFVNFLKQKKNWFTWLPFDKVLLPILSSNYTTTRRHSFWYFG